MIPKSLRALFLVIAGVMLCACQPIPPLTAVAPIDSPAQANPQTVALAQAEQFLHEYYAALQKKNYEQAASLLYSNAGFDRGEISALWQSMDEQGWQILQYEIKNGRMFDENRAVFKVSITQKNALPEQFEGYNVMQRESDSWYFSSGILDFLTLLTEPRTINEVTILPGLMIRGVTHIEMITIIDNGSDVPIRWGHEGAICGALLFEDGDPFEFKCRESVVVEPHHQATVSLVFSVDAFSPPGSNLPKYIQIFQVQPDKPGETGELPAPWEYRITLRYPQP